MPLNAKLAITTALRENKTILQHSLCTQPFKIADITEDKSDRRLHLMLMSSSPGVLDGDFYYTEIVVGQDSFLRMDTQSYQRIFTMKTGAQQQLVVKLMPRSSYIHLPQPMVLHQGAILNVRNKIFLSDGCSLVWGEVINCGRKLNGEVFQFSHYHGITEIYHKNKLVVKENLRLIPTEIDLTAIGQLEGFTHQATLLFVNEQANIAIAAEQIHKALLEENNISFGVSALPINGLIVRILGQKAEQLFSLLKKLSNSLLISNKQEHQNTLVNVC